MSVREVPSYSLHCDGCDERFENGDGWTLFADKGYARESAMESDWLIRPGLDLCPICWEAKPYCRDENNECLRRDVTEADDGWLYCPDHIEQGMDA